MKRTLFLATCCGLTLAACAVTTSQQAYTPVLIKQIGAGSRALANSTPALDAGVRAAGALSFSDPATAQATTYLAEGQLNKLSATDLVGLANASSTADAHIGIGLAKLDQITKPLSAATVTARSY